ncbi:MAG: DUF4269 domain-containing protein [Rhodospirillaceae bacterium]
MKPPYTSALTALRLPDRLAAFDPVVIGTPPLNLAIESSDIDIACSAPELAVFSAFVQSEFGDQTGFALRPVTHLPDPAMVAGFVAQGWQIELFCQNLPTREQWGVRHFYIEKRLLGLAPRLRDAVLRLKQLGLKTEPAFAQLLDLPGDPYAALLGLESWSEAQLKALLASQGFDRIDRI